MRNQAHSKTLADFMSFVTVRGQHDCWLWTGRMVGSYGRFFDTIDGHSKDHVASRWLHQHLHGRLPRVIQVCHTCDNPRCVNPGHLYAGTARTNAIDSVTRGRHWSKANPSAAAKGIMHGHAKLNDEKVRAIRASISSGLTSSAVAKQYGVNKTTVCRIARRVLWRHVEDSK